MKIQIPKGFFEDKSNVTPTELLGMVTNMVSKINSLEEENSFLQTYNQSQDEFIKELKVSIADLTKENERLKRGISA